MARYQAKHSARRREREEMAGVRRLSRTWALSAAGGLAILIVVVIMTSGGWSEAVRTFSGQDLKTQEAALQASPATATPEVSSSVEPSTP